MSIYSGFPTRRDEQKYNSLLSKLILTLQTHLLQLIGDAVPPQAKVLAYGRIIAKMKDYEEHKYLPPKFTQLLAPLCKTLGIAAATEQRLPTEADEKSNCHEKVKVSTQSLNKYRARSQFHLSETEERESTVKMDSMVLPKQFCNEINASKRSQFQSEFDLKERKLNTNILPPRDDKLKSTENYDEPEQPEKWMTLMQTRTAKGANVAKLKANLRYQRPFQGQEGDSRRKGAVREEQRMLKTSEYQPQ